jgi:hypothetical protein
VVCVRSAIYRLIGHMYSDITHTVSFTSVQRNLTASILSISCYLVRYHRDVRFVLVLSPNINFSPFHSYSRGALATFATDGIVYPYHHNPSLLVHIFPSNGIFQSFSRNHPSFTYARIKFSRASISRYIAPPRRMFREQGVVRQHPEGRGRLGDRDRSRGRSREFKRSSRNSGPYATKEIWLYQSCHQTRVRITL